MPTTILDIKKSLIADFGILGSESYQKNQNGKIFTAILMTGEGITQDQIIQLTGLPRTAVSESVNHLKKMSLIGLIKHPKIRKKVYIPRQDTKTAIRMYLLHDLEKYKENIEFIRGILNDIEDLGQNEPNCIELDYFKKYLLLFQQQNTFVIDHFAHYLALQTESVSFDETSRSQIFSKLQAEIQKKLSQVPKEEDFINLLIGERLNQKFQAEINDMKKNYIQKFMRLMENTEKNPLFPAIVNILFIENIPPTQDRYIELLGIPRSTLSDGLKRVEGDRLIKSIRFNLDGKIHYFPAVPRNLLLSVKYFAMIRQLIHVVKKMRDALQVIHENFPDASHLNEFLEQAIQEYECMIDFLFSFEISLNDEFHLGLL